MGHINDFQVAYFDFFASKFKQLKSQCKVKNHIFTIFQCKIEQ